MRGTAIPPVPNGVRWVMVTGAVVFVTTLSVDATHSLQGSKPVFVALLDSVTQASCTTHAVPVTVAGVTWCVDRFPSVPGSGCPVQEVRSPRDTTANLAASACVPKVAVGELPWRYVSQQHATQLCAKAGKSVLPGAVWYHAALGSPDDASCHTNSDRVRPNTISTCVSAAGAYDMVGNVWEWVADRVKDGRLRGQQVPGTGYVQEVSSAGWPTRTTSSTVRSQFPGDYAWFRASGTNAVMRGGFFGSGADAGINAIHADVSPAFASEATGVRCGYRLQD
jgi:hypothetical protein